jgi:acyl dehydratase
MIEWFDDLSLGMRFKSKEVQITGDDIKRFATEFDPQPFHLDEAAAEHSVFKGLAASGWHTAAIAMRLAVEVRPFGPHPLVGLGVDDLRWMAPVRPGDVLHIEGEVVSLTPLADEASGYRGRKMDRLHARRRGGIYIHSHRDRTASAGRLNRRGPYRLIAPIRFQGAGGGRLQQSR